MQSSVKTLLALPLNLLLILPFTLQADSATYRMPHLRDKTDLGELRDLQVDLHDGALQLSTDKAELHAWAVIPAPKSGWDLGRRATVDAQISNTGPAPVEVMLWVVGNHGWSAVVDSARLAPQESRTFSCNLGETYPDGTPKLNPGDVKQLQVMLAGRIQKPVSIEVKNLTGKGEAPEWRRPPGRIDVPAVEDAVPAPGKRVRYRLNGDEKSAIYSIVQLPQDWQSGRRYPVIVELPGNIYIAPACYSTGLPDQCVIGHGITKGKGAICLGLPFVDRKADAIVENGWGNPDDTAEYVMRMVETVCQQFGGDRKNVVLTGFSRGAIACGYIGLRNDRIAGLWKGFHACQHYDGGGWNGATLPGALERAVRFQGKSVFQTDNPQEKYQPVMDAMKTHATWAQSGLNFHSTAMFLDDRPSTQQLRKWFWSLVDP
jgi:hypothetical protein